MFAGFFAGHFNSTIVPYTNPPKPHFKNTMVPHQLPLRLTSRNMASESMEKYTRNFRFFMTWISNMNVFTV